MQMVGGIHHRRRDGLVGAVEVAGIALPDAHVRTLVLLGGDDDLRHGLHDLRGMLAGGGLRGQHDGIGPLHDRVGHVGDLRTRRDGGRDHGLHHLRGRDHHAILMARLLHDLLLQTGELGEAHFDARDRPGPPSRHRWPAPRRPDS